MCAFNAPDAQAGEWEIMPIEEDDVTTVYPGVFTFQSGPYALSEDLGFKGWWEGYGYLLSDGDRVYRAGTTLMQAEGTFSVKLHYNNHGDPNDVPTAAAYLRVDAYVDADAVAKDHNGVRVPARDSATATITPLGTNYPLSDDSVTAPTSSSNSYSRADKTFLVKINPGGALDRTLEVVTLNSEAKVTGSVNGDGGNINIFLEFGGEISDYSLGLSRVGAPPPVSQSNPDFNADRDEYIDGDGEYHGHTTYSYNSYFEDTNGTALLTVPHPNVQNFAASLSLPTGEVGQWQWTPPSDDDTEESHSQEMPYGSVDLKTVLDSSPPQSWEGTTTWEGTPTGTEQKIVTYSFTTSPGLELSSHYHITLHDPYEIKDQIGATDPQHVDSTWYPFSGWTANPIPSAPAPSPAPIHPTYGVSYSDSVTQEHQIKVNKGSKAEVAAGLDAGKLVPWLTGQGITLGVTGEASIAVASEQTTTTTNNQSLTYTIQPPSTIMPGWEARPAIQVLVERKQFKVLRWGPSGFLGEQVLTVDTTDDTPYRPIWEYREIIPPNPGGTG